MKNFFVHIGYPKAASTSLQTSYFSKHPELFYLGPFSGDRSSDYHNVAIKFAIEADLRVMKDFAYDEERVPQVFRRAYQEFCLSGKKLTGFSSEALTATLHHDIDITQKAERLYRLFGADTKILIVLRNQFELLRSLYRNLIVVGSPISFQEFIRDLFYNKARSVIYDLNYIKMFSLYANLFGKDNVLVLPFELLGESSVEFVAKMSEHLRIAPMDGLSHVNTSLEDAFYVALRELNSNYRLMIQAPIMQPTFQSRYWEYYSEIDQIPVPRHIAFETELADRLWVEAREASRGLHASIDYSIPPFFEQWLLSYYGPTNRKLEARTGLPLTNFGYP